MVGPLAEGLYTLKFHYCRNRVPGIKLPYSLAVSTRVCLNAWRSAVHVS